MTITGRGVGDGVIGVEVGAGGRVIGAVVIVGVLVACGVGGAAHAANAHSNSMPIKKLDMCGARFTNHLKNSRSFALLRTSFRFMIFDLCLIER